MDALSWARAACGGTQWCFSATHDRRVRKCAETTAACTNSIVAVGDDGDVGVQLWLLTMYLFDVGDVSRIAVDVVCIR